MRVLLFMIWSFLRVYLGTFGNIRDGHVFVLILERNQDLVLRHVYLSVHNDLILRPFVSPILSILSILCFTLNFMFFSMGH